MTILCCGMLLSSAWGVPKLEVTGILLSSSKSSAIINGKYYSVNDTIAGGTITAIEKGGVTILIDEKTWSFPISGLEQTPSTEKKTVSSLLQQLKNRIETIKKRANQKLTRN